MLEIKKLYAGYNGVDVIFDINFSVNQGENLCIIGPNGCGKSTLLKAIACLINYRGEIQLTINNGQITAKKELFNIKSLSRKELAKKIALLSQNVQVFFPYTVYETVSMGRYAHLQGFLKTLTGKDREIIEEILIKLNIYDIKDCMIDELSGGTLQRVFLAKTLAQTPDVILLDEPANHLDLKHQIELLDFLKIWVKENNKTLIGVFHDLNLTRRFADTAIVMDKGKIAAYGNIDEVLNSEILNAVYEIDVRSFMKESLEIWK